MLDQKQMEKLGMGSLLGVSRGSDEPPKLVILKYKPSRLRSRKGDLLALVGKGITFDSGGISLKPGENMELMKYDMTGAATVIGTMRAIAQLKPSISVLGVAPCSENLPSGKATKPGDVLRAMTGKTIEVINTDAEGRLILADAIAYTRKLGATRIIDMATLGEPFQQHDPPTGPDAEPHYRQRQDYGPDDAVPLVLEGKEIDRIPVCDLLP